MRPLAGSGGNSDEHLDFISTGNFLNSRIIKYTVF
jgi:hypothetical protein